MALLISPFFGLISILFIILENTGTFMKDFFNLMSFGCSGLFYYTVTAASKKSMCHFVDPEANSIPVIFIQVFFYKL